MSSPNTNGPWGHLVAVLDATEPEGKPRYHELGPVWRKKQGEGFIGTIERVPTEWLGHGVTWRVLIQPRAEGGRR